MLKFGAGLDLFNAVDRLTRYPTHTSYTSIFTLHKGDMIVILTP
jgi:hypothetical protein